MFRYTLIATAAFGVESVVAQELRNLGYNDLKVENGRVFFEGNEYDIARTNLWLRSADRVLIKMGEFKAETFEELFQGTKSLDWHEILPVNANFPVTGKSVRSKLYSVPDCQAIVKKAIVEKLKQKYKKEWFEERGPIYKIEVSLLKDVATLTIDTSGAGLHKRGYRLLQGEAPLRETLAAAIILLSRWDVTKPLMDPFCGSGTIPIEAAMIGKNMAPGLFREFVSEKWPQIPKRFWNTAREEAKNQINGESFRILASDIDGNILKVARENAKRAGVEQYISFQKLSFENISSKKENAFIICNPPYGERMGEEREVERLYRKMGEVFSKLEGWSFFVLTAHPKFQELFGRKADKNRKLYNGKIKCYLYQYFGKK